MKDNATLAIVKFLHDLNNFLEVEEDMPGGGRVATQEDPDDDDDDEVMYGDKYDPVPKDILVRLQACEHAISLTLPMLKLADDYMAFRINDSVFNKRWSEIKDATEELQTEMNHESAAPEVKRLLDQYGERDE